MLERDKIVLSQCAIDPEIKNNFDSYEDLDYDSEKDINPDPDTIEMDALDGDLWIDY